MTIRPTASVATPANVATPRRGRRPAVARDPVRRRDRDRVHTLVQQVGTAQLRFRLDDVRRAARSAPPHLMLERPEDLAGHLGALLGTTIQRTERTALPDAPTAAAPDARGTAPGRRAGTTRTSTPAYVLAERAAVLAAGPPPLDDRERAYLALWIATEVLGDAVVPTAAVTAVQHTIGDLAVHGTTPVNNYLVALATRAAALVRKHPPDDHGWVRWEPIGGAPTHPALEGWIARARRDVSPAHIAAGLGHATGNSLIRELVERGIAASVSKDWPVGHSLVVTDLDAVAGTDARAAEITAAMRRSGRSIGDALGDVTKTRIVSRVRVQQHVIKISDPGQGAPYYDVPSVPGAERRALIIPYRRLMRDAHDRALGSLERERTAAQRLVAAERGRAPVPVSAGGAGDVGGDAGHAALVVIAAARQLAVFTALHALLVSAEHLVRQATLLSPSIRRQVVERERAIHHAVERAGGAAARDALEETLGNAGVPAAALDRARPLLTGSEYTAFSPSAQLAGRRPAVVLANATPLRRFPNPRHTSKQDPDPVCAAPTAVDRLDALIYAADMARGKTLMLLRAARHLLGPDVRDSRVVHPLLASTRPSDRQLALAALVGLGAPEAVAACTAVLQDATLPPDHVVDALHGLLLLRRVTPAEWPAHIRDAPSPMVRAAARDVVFAARDGRWLLQP